MCACSERDWSGLSLKWPFSCLSGWWLIKAQVIFKFSRCDSYSVIHFIGWRQKRACFVPQMLSITKVSFLLQQIHSFSCRSIICGWASRPKGIHTGEIGICTVHGWEDWHSYSFLYFLKLKVQYLGFLRHFPTRHWVNPQPASFQQGGWIIYFQILSCYPRVLAAFSVVIRSARAEWDHVQHSGLKRFDATSNSW